MSTNRIQRFIAVGLTVTVSLFLLVLAVRVGLTAAATGTFGASSSRTLHGDVWIQLKGPWSNPGRGRFTMSGVISDRGRFRNHPHYEPGRGVRIFFGRKGTIRIYVDHFGFWRITKGTKAYAGLRGRGRYGSTYRGNQGPIDVTMWGTVSK